MTQTPDTSRDTKADAASQARYVRPKDVDNRSTFLQRLQWRLEAFAWDHFYWNRFGAMPIDKASARGAALVRWLGPKIGRSAHRTALRNIAMAFPDWTPEEVEACVMKSWENFGRIAGELPQVWKIRFDGDDPRITVVGGEKMDAIRDSGKPCVIISCHMANWEVMATPITSRLPDCEITYRSVNNPHIDKRMADVRLKNSVKLLAAKGIGTRDLMRALSKGRSIALMNDQKFNEGLPVPFFGYDAMTAPGPTRLAHKYKAPLLPISTQRTGPARYTVTIHDPIWPDFDKPADQAVAQTLPVINAWVEEQIRKAPDQWFWQHNRWPKDAWKKADVM